MEDECIGSDLQDVVDHHWHFRQHITDRLEQVLREEDAHARFEPERGTRSDRKVGVYLAPDRYPRYPERS